MPRIDPTDITATSPLDDIARMFATAFDDYYMMSDSPDVYRRGKNAERHILNVARSLPADDPRSRFIRDYLDARDSHIRHATDPDQRLPRPNPDDYKETPR